MSLHGMKQIRPMSNYEYLSLNRTHENQICEFYGTAAKAGSIRFSLCRDPLFFDALAVEGDEPEVFVMRKKDNLEIMGSVITSKKLCFVSSGKISLGYLSSLRLSEQYRNRLLGFYAKAYYQHQHENKRLISLITIFENNEIARKNLLTGKGYLPLFMDLGLIRTRIFKPVPIRTGNFKNSDIIIRSAEKADLSQIIDFINEYGRRKTFFPVYEAEHFNSESGLLKHLKIEDFAVAFNKNKLTGLIGLWDQTSFRYWKIHSYSKTINLLKPVINIASWLSGKPTFPSAGVKINYRNLALVCIKNDDRMVFNSLLNHHFKNMSGMKKVYLAYAMHESNPFFNSFPVTGIDLKSRLFLTYWKEDEALVSSIKLGEIYIETGAI